MVNLPARRMSHRPIVSVLGIVAVILSVEVIAYSGSLSAAIASAPVITNVAATNIGATSGTISWTTDAVSDTQIEFGTTAAYGASTTLVAAPVTSHIQNLTGLSANQIYHYRVKSRDAIGELSVSGDRTFLTALGSTTPGAATDSSNSGTMNVTRVTTAAGGQVSSLSVHVGAVDATLSNRSFQLAIYNANGSVPGTLVASTVTGTLVANSWNTLPITAMLAPTTAYYIAYNSNGSSGSVNNMHMTNGGTSGWSTAGQVFGVWPASFGAFSSKLQPSRSMRRSSVT